MKEITRTKRLEVAHYYLLGYTYKEIEEETGISHGNIANIVSEIEGGHLHSNLIGIRLCIHHSLCLLCFRSASRVLPVCALHPCFSPCFPTILPKDICKCLKMVK